MDMFKTEGFTANHLYNVNFKSADVGNIIQVQITIDYWVEEKDNWLCDYIEIKNLGKLTRFPVYSYIERYTELCSGKATLPHKVKDERALRARNDDVFVGKRTYRWVPSCPGFPRYIDADIVFDHLPPLLQTRKIKADVARQLKSQDDIKNTMLSFVAKNKEIRTFDDFFRLTEELTLPKNNYHLNWDKDEVCGWQMLNGVHPLAFSACKSIPSYFLLNDEDVSQVLRGRTLQQEMDAGTLYISDYTERYRPNSGLVYIKGAHCPPAVALFHVNAENKFVPIAIQLQPSDRDYLYVADGSQAWLLAKMYFRCCVSIDQEWNYHLFSTHFTMEPFTVALFRCLPRSHPIYKLLRPHLKRVSGINTAGRENLLITSAPVYPCLAIDGNSSTKEFYKSFHFQDLNIPKQLAKQGLDPTTIPNYWYGKDILELWDIINQYVTEVVEIYYTNGDEDVLADWEIQEWMHEIASEGFGWEDGNTHGFPNECTSLNQLIELCTITIGTGSIQHAAVNFGQLENYRFQPSSPFIMNLPPHNKSENVDSSRIMKSLPTLQQTVPAIAMVGSLSYFSEDETFLGNFSEQWFVEGPALAAQMRFRERLAKISTEIETRNKSLDRPYNHLNPKAVPNGVAA